MKKVLSINGSPKGKRSTSYALLEYINKKIFSEEKEIISLATFQKSGYREAIKKVKDSESIIIAFPLYVDCIPALLQDFMEKYNETCIRNRDGNIKNLYAVINCGFPEAGHNRSAMEIMKCFAARSGFKFRYGIGIGMGGMINPNNIPPTVKIVRPVYDGLEKIPLGINDDKNKGGGETDFISPHINLLGRQLMKKFYIFMGHMGWKQLAGKNGVRDKLDASPYTVKSI